MWKPRPDEKSVSPTPPAQPKLTPPSVPFSGPARETRLVEAAKSIEPFRAETAAHIGKSVLVKGELSGSEDLYLDGEVEGTIDLKNHTLVVGPNGRIHASIAAREIVLHGKIEGNITGAERVELKTSCILTGDITTKRIVIEDGAFFKGVVDLQRESKTEPRKAVAAAAGADASPVAALIPQASLLEHT